MKTSFIVSSDFPQKDRVFYFVIYDLSSPRLLHTKVNIGEAKPDSAAQPKFPLNYYLTSIVEGWSSQRDPFLTVRAFYWRQDRVRYRLADQNDQFRIDSKNGKIFLLTPLDRETSPTRTLTVEGNNHCLVLV